MEEILGDMRTKSYLTQDMVVLLINRTWQKSEIEIDLEKIL